jgi:hypothetical protein
MFFFKFKIFYVVFGRPVFWSNSFPVRSGFKFLGSTNPVRFSVLITLVHESDLYKLQGNPMRALVHDID